MIELFPAGFEEVESDDELELAAYTNAGGEERLWQIFGPATARSVGAGWAEAWKAFHRPIRIGPLWVGPPWEQPDEDAVAVVIDPGRAFGTGAHPTTRLCLELLLDRPPSSAVDLGCGSGVLAIAAAKLGFAPVLALDLDDVAVESARANVAANAVDVEVRHADVLVGQFGGADLALANIARPEVERFGAGVEWAALITSGYLASERPRLPGWTHRTRREADGWAADLFTRAYHEG